MMWATSGLLPGNLVAFFIPMSLAPLLNIIKHLS